MNLPKACFSIITLCGLLSTTGCSYLSVSERDLYVSENRVTANTSEAARNNTSIIMGDIRMNSNQAAPTLVIAFPEKPSETANDYRNITVLKKPGAYMMYLPKGNYRVFALIDHNRDDWFESSELSAAFNNLKPLVVNQGEVKNEVDLTGLSNPVDADLPENLRIPYQYDGDYYQVVNGQSRKIYDVIFDSQNSNTGLWAPTRFIRNFGANIFTVEPYDPGKIPILFVHGSTGTPQDWVHFLIRLDRSRYQPWFFYYPSGIRLSLIADILRRKLMELHHQYRFKEMCLSAHSMGGLITRAMLTTSGFEETGDFIKMYVTFATPWSGFSSADTAVSTSPKKLPVWIDLASRSKFIRGQFRKSLPADLKHYLFYGKSDLVSREKAVDQRVFRGATDHFSFAVNHQTILSNRAVFKKYEELLDNQFFPVNAD